MLNYVYGNLLNSPDKIIGHGCNALGVMGAGVALAIRNRWPGCYKKYHSYHIDYGLALGEVIWYTDNDKIIANCITQQSVGTGLQVDYKAIQNTVRRVLNFASKQNIASVSFPKIGARLAGGDWNVISQLLEAESERANVEINIYIMDKEEFRTTTKG